jgi:hypothetical protein
MNINPDFLDIIKYIFVVCLAVGVFILYPIAVIWALNTVFGLSIKYTVWSWFGVLILHIFFQGNAIISFNKKK